MNITYYIGVDVSKATLDWAVYNGRTIVFQNQSANSAVAIRAVIKAIKTLPGFMTTQSVCCLEHTGIYSAHLLSSLYKLQLPIWLESSGIGRPTSD